jgi:subfamily B ATP-binding cassette protein MsbA
MDETIKSKGHSVLTALQIGLQSVQMYPVLAAFLFLATVTQGALQGFLVWVLREVLLLFSDATKASIATLTLGAAAILGVWVLRALSTFAGEMLSVSLGRRVEIDSMQRLLMKMLTLSIRFFERSSQADLVMASYADLKGVRTVTISLGTIILSIARLVGLGIVAWLMSPKLAIIGLVCMPLGVIPAQYFGQRISKASRAERGSRMSLHDSFLQVSSGIKLIKVNRSESRVMDTARSIGGDLYKYAVARVRNKGSSRFLFEVVVGFGLITVLVVGGRDVATGELEWQSLLALLVAVMAVYSPMMVLLGVYSSIRAVIPNLDRVDEILKASDTLQDDPDPLPLPEAPSTIELQDVSFEYDNEKVLESISAIFKRGETIGIVGPSGAGKSTLLGLLLRLHDPTSGQILFDGVDLRRYRHADLMDLCGIVLQEPFLFLETIANNIRMPRPEATMEEVIAAAKIAGIHDEIAAMPDGYETLVGRRKDARGVSVGQKQRICIASAVLKNAPILFLDEATSSLDSVAERKVQEAIDRLMEGRTTFVVAHRLSTLRTASRILVLEKGKRVGFDTHQKLLKTCPTYKKLWNQQSMADPVTEKRQNIS